MTVLLAIVAVGSSLASLIVWRTDARQKRFWQRRLETIGL